MWVTMQPAELRVTDFMSAEHVYRGMSTRQEQWGPREPLFDSVGEWEQWAFRTSAERLAYEHVLAPVLNLKRNGCGSHPEHASEKVPLGSGGATMAWWPSPEEKILRDAQGENHTQRNHAVSFTCSRSVGECYALSSDNQPYSKEQGYVGVFQLAPVRMAYAMAGGAPFLYIREDGTVWLDPRNFSPSTHLYLAAPIAFDYARDCACVDDELLLVFGKLTASRLLEVRRILGTERRHEPWQHTVKTMAPHLELPNPEPPSFTELLHRRDEEHDAAVLASILGG